MAAMDRVHIFRQYFESDTGRQFAYNQALAGTLQHSPLRSLSWRVFLGVIPDSADTSTWLELLQSSRRHYAALKEEFLVDPHEEKHAEVDLAVHNPLSQAEDSPWQTYFDNKVVQEEIMQDVLRTYPEKEFFQAQTTRDMMLQILFVYTKQHPETGYRQGMHELLAPILYLLHKEKVEPSEIAEQHVAYLANSAEYLEHDAFVIFSKFMEQTLEWFSHRPTQRGHSDPLLAREQKGDSPVVVKCKHIQDVLLRKADRTLHAYLVDMGIEPQIYALRWIRLVFGREFHLDDVLVLWDAIFAYGKDLALIDYIGLAMLLYIRTQLLQQDSSGVLQRLMHYPPVEDVTIFVHKALETLDPEAAPRRALHKSQYSGIQQEKKRSTVAAPEENLRHKVMNALLDDPGARYKAAYLQSVETRKHMAHRMERIVYIMEDCVRQGTTLDSDTLISTVAELKQVRDVLNGDIDDDVPALVRSMMA